jgi:hypothetical protein
MEILEVAGLVAVLGYLDPGKIPASMVDFDVV